MRARHRRPVMYFSGRDAHLRYVTVAVLDRLGGVALETTVPTRAPDRLLAVLAPFRPLEVVVETCPFWPWLYDLLVPAGIGFHLAHPRPRAAHCGRGRGRCHCPPAGDDPRHRAVSEPAPGRRARADLALPPRRAPGELRRPRTSHAELGRPHAPRQHSAGGQSVGARGARLGDPEPCALRADEAGNGGRRAAEGPTRVAGGPGGGCAEVGPSRLCAADPPDALARRAGGWRRQGRVPKLTCRSDDLILLIDPSRSYSQIMRP